MEIMIFTKNQLSTLNSTSDFDLTLFHAGGGKFTLSAIYHLKSPELGDKGGVMGYQNSSWDICDPIKKVSGPKIFSGPTPGPAKFGRRKIWVSQILEFLTSDPNLSLKIK